MKRYDLRGDAHMRAEPEGRYVEFDDLSALVSAAEDALWLFDQPPCEDLASDARNICRKLRDALQGVQP